MKVLIIVPCLSGGGAEFVACQWASYLTQSGDSVTLYTTHSREGDRAPDGVMWIEARRGSIVKRMRDLTRYLCANEVDAIVSLMPYWNLISIAAATRLGRDRPKTVISGRIFTKGMAGVDGGASAIQEWLARRAYRRADLFVAISHPVGAEAIAEYRIPPERVAVVPNPAAAKLGGAAISSTQVSDPGHLDLVVPARLADQKRPLVAIDVAAILSSVFPNGVTLHFFGEGPLFEAIVLRARTAGVDVVMHGWVEEWFAACPPGSVVLMTSIAEGFGNVLVEAAAAGFRSVVSSRCMGAADAVIPGLTGELIANDSPDAYAAAVLATSREVVGDVQPWLRRFSYENSGGILHDLLLQLVRSS